MPAANPWTLKAVLDAPGGGNWQGVVTTPEHYYVAHSRKRADGTGEDLVLYRRAIGGGEWDRMTFERCTHWYGGGVSDTGVVWLTWNDRSGNDVVTVQYKPGATLRSKSQTRQMHVLTDRPAWVSFSPSRAALVVMEDLGGEYGFTKRLKSDILDGVDRPKGRTIRRPKGGWLQGFSCVNDSLLLLYGAPEGKARVERWDVLSGRLEARLDVTPTSTVDGVRRDQYEVEGMDGRTFGYKLSGGADRRMAVYELDKTFTG